MKKKALWFVVIASLALLGGVMGYIFFGPSTNGSSGGGFRTISPLEAKTLIETRQDLLLVDVRSPEEFQGGGPPRRQAHPILGFRQRSVRPAPRPADPAGLRGRRAQPGLRPDPRVQRVPGGL